MWPFDGGDLVRVKDDYMRDKLREKARRVLVVLLGGTFLALVFFFVVGKFIVEPIIMNTTEQEEGVCPIGSLTNRCARPHTHIVHACA